MAAAATAAHAPFAGVYAGRRVFVTGHTGFKGAWLSLWLRQLGASLAGYALDPPSDPSLFEVLDLGADMRDVRGDVRDEGALRRALVAHSPEIVFHLAAQALVRPSYADPVGTYATNVMGTVHLLEAVRRCPSVRAVVVVTSDKCYENRESDHAYREDDPLGGRDPYSSSKGCAELVARAYRASFLDGESAPVLATARAGNVIGGGDWGADRLLPDCARAFGAGDAVAVRNPGAVRPWQFVLEPLAGYLWLAAGLLRRGEHLGGAWNFGPPPEGDAAVRDVVAAFVRHWGSGEWVTLDAGGDAPHEAALLKLDSSRAAEMLGWRTVYGLDTAVAETAAWYKAYYAGGGDLCALSKTQLAAYAAAAAAAGHEWAVAGGRSDGD